MMRAGKNVDPAIVGRVPAYAWPGGYPIVCIVQEVNRYNRNEGLWCPCCANQAAWQISPEDSNVADSVLVLIAYDVHWEGQPIECDVCGEEIESAYGDPEEASEDA